MLCKAGGLSKRQLGSIRILDNETHVEIDALSIEGFMAQVGEGGKLEKSIRVTRLDHAPAQEPRSRRDFGDRPQPRGERPKEPRGERPNTPRGDRPPPQREAYTPRGDKPQHEAYAKKDRPKFEGKKFDGPKPGKRDRKSNDAKHAGAGAPKKAKWHPVG